MAQTCRRYRPTGCTTRPSPRSERSGTVIGTDALGRPFVSGQIYDPASSRQMPDGTWIGIPFREILSPRRASAPTTVNVLKYDVPDPPLDTFKRNQPWVDGWARS